MRGIHLPPAPTPSSESVRASMRSNKSSNTKPEMTVVELLRQAGVTGFTSNNKNIPGSPDIAFKHAKVAAFIHGCFWHRCPYCNPHFPETNRDYWYAKFARNKARDHRVRMRLRKDDWMCITIWECKLKKTPKRTVSRIMRALEKASG